MRMRVAEIRCPTSRTRIGSSPDMAEANERECTHENRPESHSESGKKRRYVRCFSWCPGPDSNRHEPIRVRRILSPLRLPISPPGHCLLKVAAVAPLWMSATRGDRKPLPGYWRRGSESNRRTRLCRPLHDHSATPPLHLGSRKAYTPSVKNKTPVLAPRFLCSSVKKGYREGPLCVFVFTDEYMEWCGKRDSHQAPNPLTSRAR